MKTVRIIIASLLAISAFLMAVVPILSSYMQNHYKNQLDDFTKETKVLLEKKQFWAQIGESPIFLYIFLGCLSVLSILLLIVWLRRRV